MKTTVVLKLDDYSNIALCRINENGVEVESSGLGFVSASSISLGMRWAEIGRPDETVDWNSFLEVVDKAEAEMQKVRAQIIAQFITGKAVVVEDAPAGIFLNIGLREGRTSRDITYLEVLAMLPKQLRVISKSIVHGEEPTLFLEVTRPITSEEMVDLLRKTKQQAIPQLVNGVGTMYDTKKGTEEGWGEFNPEYFLLSSGKPLLIKIK